MEFLRLPVVIERTGYSASTIWRKVAEGVFPRPVKLNGNAGSSVKRGTGPVAWKSTDIDDWQKKVLAANPAASASR